MKKSFLVVLLITLAMLLSATSAVFSFTNPGLFIPHADGYLYNVVGDSVYIIVGDTVIISDAGIYWDPDTVVSRALVDSIVNAYGRFAGAGGLTYWTESDAGDTSVFTATAPNTWLGFDDNVSMKKHGIFKIDDIEGPINTDLRIATLGTGTLLLQYNISRPIEIYSGLAKKWTFSSNNLTGESGTVIDGATWQGVSIADAYIATSGNWNTAYGWGDHSAQNYLDNDDVNVDTLGWSKGRDSGLVAWNWGDHSAQGYVNSLLSLYAYFDRTYFDTAADAGGDSIVCAYSDSTDLSIFDTDDLTEGASNKYDQALPDSNEWSTAYDSSQVGYLNPADPNVDTAAWNAGGSGEANTLSDTGTFNGTEGFGLAGGKTGTALKVKGLIEGANITIAASGDSAYTVTAAGGGATLEDVFNYMHPDIFDTTGFNDSIGIKANGITDAMVPNDITITESDPVWVSDSADYAFKTWTQAEIEDSLNEYSLTSAITSLYFDTAEVVDTVQGILVDYVTDANLEDSLDSYFDTAAVIDTVQGLGYTSNVGTVTDAILEDSLDSYFDTAATVDTIQGLMGDYVTDANLTDSLNSYFDTTATVDTIQGVLTEGGYITNSKLSDSSITLLNATAWRLFYSNATTTAIQELVLGSDGTYLKSNGASSAPTWATPGGAGWNWTDSTGFLVGWGGVAKSVVNDTNYFRFEGGADFDTTGGSVSIVDDSHNHIITNIDAFSETELETQLSDVTAVFTNNVTGDVTVSGGTSTIGAGVVESTMIGADQVNDLDINFGSGTDQVNSDDLPAHTGDVTGGTALTIAANAVESTMIGVDQVNDLDINFGTGTDQVSTDDVTEGTAKYNVTHTGDVTGATELTIAANIIDTSDMAHAPLGKLIRDTIAPEIRDTAALVAHDTADVLRAEMDDSAAAHAGDTADVVRAEIADIDTVPFSHHTRISALWDFDLNNFTSDRATDSIVFDTTECDTTMGIHPDVEATPNGWPTEHYDGDTLVYSRWLYMIQTPAYQGCQENPTIYWSADKTNWFRPFKTDTLSGDTIYVPVPLCSFHTGGLNTDPQIVIGHDGDMYAFWRWKDADGGDSTENIYVKSSSNAINWGDSALLFSTNKTTAALSPAVLFDDDNYYRMWTVDQDSADNVIRLELSATPTGFDYTKTYLCTLSNIPANWYVWHINIAKAGGLYVMVATMRNAGDYKNWLAKSYNGLNWTFSDSANVLSEGSGITGAWDKTFVYTGDIVPRITPNGYVFDYWYSGNLFMGAPTYQIGYTTIEFPLAEIEDSLNSYFDTAAVVDTIQGVLTEGGYLTSESSDADSLVGIDIQAKTGNLQNNYILKVDIAGADTSLFWEADAGEGGALTYWTESDDNDTSVFTATGPNTTVGLNDNLTMQGNDITVPLIIGGAGTTSDLTLKTTSGVGTTGADMHFRVGNNGATVAMTILNDGKVGINTTSPDEKLHITDNNAALKLEDDSGNDAKISVGNSQLCIGADPDNLVASSDICFDIDGSEVARFHSSTNFGIGTLSPPERLSVVGNIATGDTTTGVVDIYHYFSIDGSYTTEYFPKWADALGRFEISDDLDVTGTIKSDDTLFYTFILADPDALYATDTQWGFDPKTKLAITIRSIYVSLDADPTTEMTFSVVFCDAGIGWSNPTTIDDTATVAGVTDVTGGFSDPTVPAGKKLYFLFDADPDDAITQADVKIGYTLD